MRAIRIFIISYSLSLCSSALAALEDLQNKDLSCTSLLQSDDSSASKTESLGLKVLKARAKPRFFSPEKSHLELKLKVGSKAIHYSRIIPTDHDPKNRTHQIAETEKLMHLSLQYAEHIQKPGIFSRELENFGRLNAILLAPLEFEVQEDNSNSILEIRSEILDLDMKIQQKHNLVSSQGSTEFDPESLGELLIHLTQSKDRLLFALKDLTEVQIRFRLLEIQKALNENPELLESDFSEELAEFLKNEPDTVLKVLSEASHRESMPWTIALLHPQDRLITALIYEILANRPQELEFIKIFSAPEPEDEDEE